MMGVIIAIATVAAIKMTARHNLRPPGPHSSAAASIDRPMTLRMSTLSEDWSDPPPSNADCRRKRNASRRSARPGAPVPAAVCVAPPAAPRPAASAIATPARTGRSERQSRRRRWPICRRCGRDRRRVHESSVCASIMISTATPRSQSRYARLLTVAMSNAGVTSNDS